MRRASLFVACLLLLVPGLARGDEFKLKDGSTIVGSVVGYVGNSFKVKTSYGYALVEKDKIVSIRIASAPEASPAAKSKTDAETTPGAEKRAARAEKKAAVEEHGSPIKAPKSTAVTAAPPGAAKTIAAKPSPAPANTGASSNSAAAVTPVADAMPSSSAAPSASPASVTGTVPAALPEPQPIREKVVGNTYVNDTYDFQMYKPPDWQVMDGARSVLPGAIAAMGTDDQSTYLVVGQQPAGKSAAAEMAATEKRLSDILVNFRPLNDEHLTVAGEPVVAQRFRGSVDEHDWSGFMVFLPRGGKLYTIFGMTRADNDLVQIQENVIRRTISSFQFLPQ